MVDLLVSVTRLVRNHCTESCKRVGEKIIKYLIFESDLHAIYSVHLEMYIYLYPE